MSFPIAEEDGFHYPTNMRYLAKARPQSSLRVLRGKRAGRDGNS